MASVNALQRHPPEESSTVFSSPSVEAAKRKLKKIKQWSEADILCNCSRTGTAICDAVNFYGLRGEPNRIASGANHAIVAIQRNTLYLIRPPFGQGWARPLDNHEDAGKGLYCVSPQRHPGKQHAKYGAHDG